LLARCSEAETARLQSHWVPACAGKTSGGWWIGNNMFFPCAVGEANGMGLA
jgi:hypothetical protein